MEMNQTNPGSGNSGMNMGSGMPNNSSQSPKHKSHGGLIAAIVIVVVAAIVAVFLINRDSSMTNYKNEGGYSNTNVSLEGDTVILEDDASDDLDSIENDLDSLDFDDLDMGLE